MSRRKKFAHIRVVEAKKHTHIFINVYNKTVLTAVAATATTIIFLLFGMQRHCCCAFSYQIDQYGGYRFGFSIAVHV